MGRRRRSASRRRRRGREVSMSTCSVQLAIQSGVSFDIY
jgi:hypothetical protein